MKPARAFLLAAAICGLAQQADASCGAAFCLVNTDWSAQGAWNEPGARLDLRYESIDLDQVRTGSHRIAVGEIPHHHDEVETRNRNFVTSLDWTLSPRWAAMVSLPYVDRDHYHIHNHRGEKLDERWSFRGIGDARVQARYQLMVVDEAEAPRAAGMSFGLKLPTGKYDVANSAGALAERTLQPGSGTTDAVIGTYWHGLKPAAGWSWFARAGAVLPLNKRAEFQPGRQLQADCGVRYAVSNSVSAMLQVNAVVKARDRGAEAEPADSGQRALFASPGGSWNFSPAAQVYAYVQLPVYQWVNGVQLTAKASAVVGASMKF